MRKNYPKKSFGTCGKILLASCAILVMAVAVQAESYQTLYPCLIDLSGWTGGEPTGMNMNMSGMVMINSTRTYSKGKKELRAIIMKGNQAFGMAGMQGSEMHMESPEVNMNIKTINGFQVQTVYDKKENSGAVTVFLTHKQTGGAFFSLSYAGISEKEAIGLAKKFDWEKIKSKIQSLR
ncbi:MAG: hypothetical protein DRH21_01965 [Deltaproteobacteria bacterium]|nr:MAG: hypothetical protein DRH21_01965 [Deltaproteobacteria bacterium]